MIECMKWKPVRMIAFWQQEFVPDSCVLHLLCIAGAKGLIGALLLEDDG